MKKFVVMAVFAAAMASCGHKAAETATVEAADTLVVETVCDTTSVDTTAVDTVTE